MIPKAAGYKVAVLGPSSLLGRELLSLLRERKFPVANLLELGGEDESSEPEAEPIPFDVSGSDSLSSRDLIFIAGDYDPEAQLPQEGATAVISLTGAGVDSGKAVLSIPSLEPEPGGAASGLQFVAPHAASIMLGTLLLSLSTRFEIERAVATIFSPASESGPRAIEELHNQTASVLSFQKLSKEIFGAQLAFNLLPRVSGSAKAGTERLEARVRAELHQYLAGRVALPSLRLVQTSAFYSMAVSLYLETATAAPAGAVEKAIAESPVRLCPPGGDAASQIGAAGSSEILVDRVQMDAARPEGIWIWAAADNLRLAAENAIQIAGKIIGAAKA